jgi:hypothetical protein
MLVNSDGIAGALARRTDEKGAFQWRLDIDQ